MATEEYILRIHEKLQQLLKQYNVLQKENEKLNSRLKETEEKQEMQLKKIEELEQKIAVLKTIAIPLNETDKKDLEKRLNSYLKDIDRCITMLSE